MKPYLFTGPLRPEDIRGEANGVLLDFIPFRKSSVTEADAKRIKTILSPDAYRLGFFDQPGLNQLLYLLTEDLINGAIIAKIGEKDLRRVAETTGRPLILDGTCKALDQIQREQRMPIFGHYFQTLPDEEILNALTKPYILSVTETEHLKDILAEIKAYPPFALRLESPALLDKVRGVIDTI